MNSCEPKITPFLTWFTGGGGGGGHLDGKSTLVSDKSLSFPPCLTYYRIQLLLRRIHHYMNVLVLGQVQLHLAPAVMNNTLPPHLSSKMATGLLLLRRHVQWIYREKS